MKPILLALALPVVALTGCSTYVGAGPGYGDGGYYAGGSYYDGSVVDVGFGGYGGDGYYNRGSYYRHHTDSGFHGANNSAVAFHNASRSSGSRVASVGHSGGASHSAASASVGHSGGGGGGHSGGGGHR